MKTYKAYYKSPIGPIEIRGATDSILSLDFVEEMQPGDADLPFCLKTCLRQIDEYSFLGIDAFEDLSLIANG